MAWWCWSIPLDAGGSIYVALLVVYEFGDGL